MSFTCHTRWLLIVSFALISACTEKAVVSKVPPDNASASSQADISEEPVSPDMNDPETEEAPEINVPDSAAKPGPAVTPSTETSSPNMVDENISPVVVANVEPPRTTTDNPEPIETEKSESETDNPAPIEPQQPTGVAEMNPPETDDTLPSDPTDIEAATESDNPAEPAINEPMIDDTDVTPAVGTPGMAVDCMQIVPCQWVSSDTQFTVTVTNADNIGRQGRLTIQYSVQTSHDSELSIASTEAALDDAGQSYEASALTLGEGIGGALQGLLAGTTIYADIEFDRPGNTTSLAEWSIGLSDSGLVRQPEFTNVPIGSATTQIADCEGTLPCIWESPNGDVKITLLLASGFGSTNRLSTNFKVETARTTVIAVDRGAAAVGIDGLLYEARTHAIGVDTSAEKISATSMAGAQVAGTIFFSRTQAMSTSLQNLSLVVYEDQPVPRWNPVFTSVPVQ